MHQGILQLIRSQLSYHSLKRGYRLQSLDYRVKLTEYLQVLLILSHWLVFLSKRDLSIHLGFCNMFFFFFFLKKGFCFLENGRVIFVSVFFFFWKSGIVHWVCFTLSFPLPSPKASIFRPAYAFRVVLDRYVTEMHWPRRIRDLRQGWPKAMHRCGPKWRECDNLQWRN